LRLVGCQLFSVFHSVGCQPDVNFIQLAARKMQISFSQPPAECKFHSVGHQPNENCIWLAAMQYKIPTFLNSLLVASNHLYEIYIRLVACPKQILPK
jgi:hypothetical protein